MIEDINKNRVRLGFKPITGSKNIQYLNMFMQEATCLLTLKQWNTQYRVIKKGEKSTTLRGATTRKNSDGEEETRYYNFRVFDITQTREMTPEEKQKYIERQDKKLKA